MKLEQMQVVERIGRGDGSRSRASETRIGRAAAKTVEEGGSSAGAGKKGAMPLLAYRGQMGRERLGLTTRPEEEAK